MEKERLEYLRQELRAERISYGELAELQSLAEHIDNEDVELLEAAGVKEGDPYPFNEGDDYWTIENGKVTWSCWDETSEVIHDNEPRRRYFRVEAEAVTFNQFEAAGVEEE